MGAVGLSSLQQSGHLKMLLLGPPKIAKTTVAVTTAPYPVRVVLCEDESALQYPLVHMRDVMGLSPAEIDKRVSYVSVGSEKEMLAATAEARADAEAGKIKTLVVDPLTFYANRLMEECFFATKSKDGNEDGRRAHPEVARRLSKLAYQWLRLPCHTIVVSHYLDVGDATKAGGDGKVPMLPNRESRSLVGGMFPYVVWMDFRNGARKWVTTPQGSWGPGCRGLRGSEEIEPDCTVLMAALGLGGKPRTTKPNGVPAKPTLPVKPQTTQPARR